LLARSPPRASVVLLVLGAVAVRRAQSARMDPPVPAARLAHRDLEGGVARQVVLDVRARAATEARRAQPVRLEALDVAVAPVVLASLDAVALVASLASLVILVALESLAEVAGLVRLGVADREADPVLVDPVASRPRADDVAFVGPKAHAGGRVHPDPTVDVGACQTDPSHSSAVLGACVGAAGRAKFPHFGIHLIKPVRRHVPRLCLSLMSKFACSVQQVPLMLRRLRLRRLCLWRQGATIPKGDKLSPQKRIAQRHHKMLGRPPWSVSCAAQGCAPETSW